MEQAARSAEAADDLRGAVEARRALVRLDRDAHDAWLSLAKALHKAGDAAAVDAVLGDCLEALRIVALLASPLIPRAAGELWRRLGLSGAPEDQRLPEAAAWGWSNGWLRAKKSSGVITRSFRWIRK